MRDEYLRRLKSLDPSVRLQAWRALRLATETHIRHLGPGDIKQLFDLLDDEHDDSVRQQASTALLHLCFLALIAQKLPDPSERKRPPKNSDEDRRTLDAWLSRHFQRRSALIGITDTNYRRRDEDALAYVSRRFPPWDFQLTDLQRVSLGDDSWLEVLLANQYETALILGRPLIFGRQALDVLQDDRLHLRFPRKDRPAGLKAGAIDPAYHFIQEQNGHAEPISHVTRNTRKARTDYGLVQVYPSFIGSRYLTVVLCAGCSSLGTLGAAWWLAHDLWRSQDANGESPIPAPLQIATDSRMEALIRVSAKLTTRAWKPTRIELCRLYVDDLLWRPDDSRWHPTRKAELVVELSPHGPVSLSINGEPLRMHGDSQSFRLASELALAIERSPDKSVSLEWLAQNKAIWDDAISVVTVKQRVHTLNHRSLQRLIVIEKDRIRLNARVIARRV
jgi:hypothetical protein